MVQYVLFAAILSLVAYFTNSLLLEAGLTTDSSNLLEFKWVELTAVQLLIGAVLSLAMAASTNNLDWNFDNRLTIMLASLSNAVGALATNAAYYYSYINSSSRAIETTQPLATFVLAAISLKGSNSLTVSHFLSVLIIVLGVWITFFKSNVLFTSWGCLVAVTLTVAFAIRNILLKQISTETGGNTLRNFVQISVLSAIFVLPLWVVQLAMTQSLSTDRLCALSGVTYSAYDLASYHVLDSATPVTHAILTTIIKASVFTSVFNFQALYSMNVLFGAVVVVIGTCLYLLNGMVQIMLKITFVMLIVIFLVVPKPTFHHGITPVEDTSYNTNSFGFLKTNVSCERISTAWTYSAPIPEFAVSNIVTLAEQNPSLPVHVFCGSKQCVEAVKNRTTANIKVEFAVVSEILKGASPYLEQWLSRHPINKVFAGREFETHLQDVTVLGILLKYGGIYVNPVLKLMRNFSDVCHNSTPGWVGKEPSLWTVNLESFLDLCFFVKNHPFIYKLGELYGKEYPVRKEDSSVFQTRFFQKVSIKLWERVCSLEVPCVHVLQGIPKILSSDYLLMKLMRPNSHFGLISTNDSLDTTPKTVDNLMQDFSGAYFLPYVDTILSSDELTSDIEHSDTLTFLSSLGATKNWKPPSSVNPVMLSVHLQNEVDGLAGKIKFLKQKEPIGCADSATLTFLADRNVSSFLSGSLMLLLNGPVFVDEQRKGIYLSNLEDEVIRLLPAEVQSAGVHDEPSIRKGLFSSDTFERYTAIYHLMNQYKSASLVITQCYHCASACVAVGTPVIYIETANSSISLASGTSSLFHTLDLHSMTSEQARVWLQDFSWKNIPPNPDLGFMMRLRATAWNVIRRNQVLLDTAKKLGVIPFSPPRILPEDRKILFHTIFTSSAKTTLTTLGSNKKLSGAFNWRHWRSLESVFRFHPTSDLVIHSNTLPQDMFDVLTEAGYSLKVHSYNLTAMLENSPAEKFIPKLPSARKGPYWVYVESDLLRLLVMYRWGGVYLDTDMYLVRPLHSLRLNGAGWQNSNNGTLNNAFLMYEKKNPFVKAVLEYFVRNYNGAIWGRNGPLLISKVWKKWKKLNNTHAMKPYNYVFFYMIHWKDIMTDCFKSVSGSKFDLNMKRLKTEAYGIHLNSKISGFMGTSRNKIKKGTLCSYVLNHFCVLCDRNH